MNKVNKNFFLHIGSHRTGSSSFQLCLNRNRVLIEKSGYGVAFPSRDGIKAGELDLKLPGPRHKENRLRRFSDRIADHLRDPRVTGACGAAILSDENILGIMRHFEQAQFYPAAEKRFQTLYAAMGSPPKHVLLVVREYSSFFSSCFRKRAEANWVKPFREIVPHLLTMDRGWYELTRAVKEQLKPDYLTVVNYKNRGASIALLKELVPDLRNVPLQEPARTLNVSATDAALVAIQKMLVENNKISRKERMRIIEGHSDQSKNLEFSEYTDIEAKELKLRFERDMERIATLSDVVLLP